MSDSSSRGTPVETIYTADDSPAPRNVSRIAEASSFATRRNLPILVDRKSTIPALRSPSKLESHSRTNPDVFTVNGKSLPRTLHPEDGSPIIVSAGDTVRLYLVNAGYTSRPLHTHNHRFQLIEKDDGRIPEAARYDQDVTNVAPAEGHTVEFEADADPGIYLVHCHKVDHAMNRNSYPGGTVTGIVYQDATASDVFAHLISFAGYGS